MLVSVIVPVYNQQEYLRQAVESALAQEITNILPHDTVDLEVIVVDDRSTDGSLAVAQECKKREAEREAREYDNETAQLNKDYLKDFGSNRDDGWFKERKETRDQRMEGDVRNEKGEIILRKFGYRMKIVEQPTNMGLSSARNAGIDATSSRNGYDLILPLDADDWIEPNYLKKTVPLMKDRVGVVGTYAAVFGIKDYIWYTKSPSIEDLMYDNCVPVCSLIRRGAFDETKGYSRDLRCGYEDYNLWIDLVERGWEITILPEPLFHYREKPHSMLKDATKKKPGLIEQIHRMHPNLWLPTGEVNPVFAYARKRLKESAERHAQMVNQIHESYPSFCSPTGRVADAKAYVGNDAVSGYLQCEILKKEGCVPESFVLDVGCGALYAGFFLSHYLNKDRFIGMEPNGWLVEAALEQDCVQKIMSNKRARFLFKDDFDASCLGIEFDFILSHSILSHAAHWQLDQFLENTNRVLSPSGKIIASLRLAEGNNLGNSGTVDKKDSKDENWLYPGNSFFQLDTVVNIAIRHGLKAELRPEFTELITSVNYSEFHDWFVFTRSVQ